MKKTVLSILALFFVVSFAAVTFAEDDGPDGNKRKGKYTYRKVYKACFERGEVTEKKPHISPADKTMAQWKRIFESKEFAEFKCAPEWENLSEEDIQDIYAYLYNYAADSPSPATCN